MRRLLILVALSVIVSLAATAVAFAATRSGCLRATIDTTEEASA